MKVQSELSPERRYALHAICAIELLKGSLKAQGHHHLICIVDRQLWLFPHANIPENAEILFGATVFQRSFCKASSEQRRLLQIVKKKIKENKL